MGAMLGLRRGAGPLGWLLVVALGCATSLPDPGLAYRQEGEAALAEGASERAVGAYQLALAVAPNDPRALRGLLHAQVADGQGEAALETLAWLEAVDSEPANPCPALAVATAGRVARGAYDEAETSARRSVAAGCEAAATGLAQVLAERAAAARGSGDRDRAIELYRGALALDSSQARLFFVTAELLIAQERVKESIELLSDGLESHPDDKALRDLMVRALSIR
jgi:tetratricopeptide (TPR) repeat protein